MSSSSHYPTHEWQSRLFYEIVSIVYFVRTCATDFLDKEIELAPNPGLIGDAQLNPSPFYNHSGRPRKIRIPSTAKTGYSSIMSVERVIESITTELRVVATPTKLKILMHPLYHQIWIWQLLYSNHVIQKTSFKANKALIGRMLLRTPDQIEVQR